MITVDEILEIDQLVLRNYMVAADTKIDPETHRAALVSSFERSKFAVVRRNDAVAAYAYLWPVDGGTWFVGGIAIHPRHQNPSVIRELGGTVIDLIRNQKIGALKSNVFKANKASVRLHHHLGFIVTRENDVGCEFTLENMQPLQRYARTDKYSHL